MYLYFDTQGNLKEQINDQALRQGNSNINYLYVYWEKSEDNENITGLWARFKADDGTYNPSSSTWIQSNTYVEQTIPYDKSRDLKFFNYFKTYKFYVIQLPDAVLGQSGAWLGTLQFVETNSITTLGQLAFYVSESNASVEADENINIAQWNYLIALVSGALDSIPTKTSDLINDSGYITSASFDGYVTDTELETTLEDYAQTDDLPTKTSDLTNDSGYQTQTQVQTAINNALTSVYKFQGSISVSDLNDYISSYTGDKNNLNGWVFNITDSGNLTNSSGTTPVAAGDNVAFYVYNTSQQLYEWDKLAGTIDTSNFVTLNGTQNISGKKTFTNAGGVYLTEQTSTPASTDGLQAQDDNHLYWKGQKIPLNSDIPTKTSDLINDSGYITSASFDGYVTDTELETTLEDYAQTDDLPTKTSDLTNDSGYQTQTQVQTAINNALTSVYKFQGSISVSDLNDYISSYTGDKNNLNGWVFNITDSGNLTNSSGTTPVAAGDNVAFYVYNTSQQLYEWDKLAGTIDTSNFVTLNGTQNISGKKTFTNAGGVYLTEQTSTPASTDGLQAQDDNHLYWKGQKIPLNSDIPTKTSDLNNDSGYITNSSLSGYVPTSRKVNNKALTGDITLTASDVGALSSSTTYVSSVNGSSGAITNIATTSDVNAKMSNPMTTQDDIVIGGSSGTPTRLAKGSSNELLGVNNSGHLAYTKGLPYITTAPSSNNTNGGLIIVVLSSEPSTYYDGYYYIITGSNS